MAELETDLIDERAALRCISCNAAGKECTCSTSPPTIEPVSANKDPWIGVVLENRYQIISLIDTGGMSRVYRAVHTTLQVVRAVKLIHRESAIGEHSLRRFEKEARAIGALSHPNLVACVDYGMAADGTPYVVMEFMEGRNIAQVLSSGERFEVIRAVSLFVQMCKGLHHAHKSLILHRDIKPGNIMLVSGEDGSEVAKILDFGIAKIHDATEAQKLTRTGEICGSPVYMSPEQGRGMDVDGRSDVYSLGCVMYEMLSGKPPFLGDNAIETIMKHINEKPGVIVGPDNKRISPGLEAVVMRCLEKEPDRRYKSLDDLRRDLELLQGGDSLMTLQVERALATQRWKRIHAISIVCLMVCFLAYSYWNISCGSESWRLDVEKANSFYYDLDAAERYLQIALNKLPANDVLERNRSAVYMSWARLYDARNRIPEARKYFEQSRSCIEKYSKENRGRGEITWLPLLADASEGFANCELLSHAVVEANVEAEKAVAARRLIVRIDQPQNVNTNRKLLAHSLQLLGQVQMSRNEFRNALKSLSEAEGIARLYPTEQLHLSTTLVQKAKVLLKLSSDKSEALSLMREARIIRLQALGQNTEHPDVRNLTSLIQMIESNSDK